MKTTTFAILSAVLFGCAAPVGEPIRADESADITSGPGDDIMGKDERTNYILTDKEGWQTTAPLLAGDLTTIRTLQANFPKSGVYTVQFGIGADPNLAVRAQADIFWSVEGNDIQRTISIANGTSISGVGQGVRVVMKDVGSGFAGSTNPNYSVFAQVSPGARPTVNKPPSLLALSAAHTILQGATFNLAVPSNSGAISFWVLSLATHAGGVIAYPQLEIIQQDATGATVDATIWKDENVWVPLAPGVTNLSITNFDPANDASFNLLWGIDG